MRIQTERRSLRNAPVSGAARGNEEVQRRFGGRWVHGHGARFRYPLDCSDGEVPADLDDVPFDAGGREPHAGGVHHLYCTADHLSPVLRRCMAKVRAAWQRYPN